jgi:NarL family two-component system response regulator LiaR
MCPLRIVLVEDHKIVREGTCQLLEQDKSLEVVGEAGDGEEALELVDRLMPDLVIMDVHIPKLNGVEATRAIKERHPKVRVLVLSAYEKDHYVFPLLEAGADGYLLKTSSGRELTRAVHAVYAGETALDPKIAQKIVNRMGRKQRYREEGMVEGLTEREIEVLQAVACGMNSKEIGDLLSISPYTVQVHLRNVFKKLGVHSRAEAVALAMDRGWITLDEQSD